eukprot:augustus_masked-scaffold_34-processed-gene-1.1-mRNA-1 protein AED:1.00 eAED:1.00 QI:0/-1/0/0/-1/1/1/0/456
MSSLKEKFITIDEELKNLLRNKRAYTKASEKITHGQETEIRNLELRLKNLGANKCIIVKPEKSVKNEALKPKYSLEENGMIGTLLKQRSKFAKVFAVKNKEIMLLKETVEVLRRNILKKKKDIGGINALKDSVEYYKRKLNFIRKRYEMSKIKLNHCLSQNNTLQKKIHSFEDTKSIKKDKIALAQEQFKDLNSQVEKVTAQITTLLQEEKSVLSDLFILERQIEATKSDQSCNELRKKNKICEDAVVESIKKAQRIKQLHEAKLVHLLETSIVDNSCFHLQKQLAELRTISQQDLVSDNSILFSNIENNNPNPSVNVKTSKIEKEFKEAITIEKKLQSSLLALKQKVEKGHRNLLSYKRSLDVLKDLKKQVQDKFSTAETGGDSMIFSKLDDQLQSRETNRLAGSFNLVDVTRLPSHFDFEEESYTVSESGNNRIELSIISSASILKSLLTKESK